MTREEVQSGMLSSWLLNSAVPGWKPDTEQQSSTRKASKSIVETVADHERAKRTARKAFQDSLENDTAPPPESRIFFPMSYPGKLPPESYHSGTGRTWCLTIGVDDVLHETDGQSTHVIQPSEKLLRLRQTIGAGLLHSQRSSSMKGRYFDYGTLKEKEDGLTKSLVDLDEGRFTVDDYCTFRTGRDPVTNQQAYVASTKRPDEYGDHYSVYVVPYVKPSG